MKLNFKYVLQNIAYALLFALILALSGCSLKEDRSSNQPPNKDHTKPIEEEITPPTITDIIVSPDPSINVSLLDGPYLQISDYVLDTYHPDQELYNYLFRAIDNVEEKVNISDYNLSDEVIMKTCESLYNQANFQFYYLSRVRWSNDYKEVSFIYTDTPESIQKNKQIYYASMSHLLYNVAPENYSSNQKFFAVYDYIISHADYTDNMADASTHTSYSILTKGQGICGGFAMLGDYVWNRLGIPTNYISNEAHAWNIVELNGKRYHSDLTWGASYMNSPDNLNSMLMDDTKRKEGLDNLGFGEQRIIVGYTGGSELPPDPCTDLDYQILSNLYYGYAFDIVNDALYYAEMDGIYRMNLNTANATKISSIIPYLFTYHNGIIYYIDSNDFHVYTQVTDETPVLLDDSKEFYDITIEGDILKYSSNFDGIYDKSIDLSPFQVDSFHSNIDNTLSDITIPREQTFSIKISFRKSMDTTKAIESLVGLVTNDDKSLPLHLIWSEDRRTVTIRSKANLSNEESIQLYVLPGMNDSDGGVIKDSYSVKINFASSSM